MDTEAVKKPGKKKKIIILAVVIAVFVILAAAFAAFFLGENYYGSHFLNGTVINGIDVSKLSVEELETKIKEYTLTVRERTSDGKETSEKLTGEQVGLSLIQDGELQDILDSQQGGKWINGKGKEHTVDELTTYDETLWKEALDKMQCFSDDFAVKPENAYVSGYNEEKNSFEMVKEVEGNTLDRKKAEEKMTQALMKLDEEVSFDGCYEKPEITSDTEQLKTFYHKLNQYAGVNIKYTFGTEVEELTGQDICGWLNIDYENNTVSLDADKVSDYVAYLRRHHDTIFGTRKFMTSYGQEVTIEGGDYGWWMNKEEEVAGLTAMIEAGESGDRTPVYSQEAAAYGDVDYGNSYVEINLTAQHLFLYSNGQRILESDFVSGKPYGHETPPGTYAVTYTQKYAILRGDTYETMVSYWMPFNEDIGLHDATWQSQLGSNLYQSIGSHGCVNLSYNVAKEMFNYVEKGMAVICYELPGTESSSITPQSDEEKAQSVIDAINEIATSSKPAKQAANARMLYKQLSSAAKAKVTNYSDLLAYEAG